ncbi:MAG TPA: DUF6090 family protein [Puia sp.]|nr:DUF6090 family protein [Puia sp.]
MQDEVTKHARKIFQEVKNREHGFWEKTREIVIEILIIVFAVTLSIWLHNWSDHRAEQKQTEEFLAGIQADLAKDIQIMEENKDGYKIVQRNFRRLEIMDSTGAVDTTDQQRIANLLDFENRTLHANVARYEGFKSNGKIGTIEDDSLRQAILSYYQQTVPAVNDIEEVVNGFQVRMMEAELNRNESLSMRVFAKSFKVHALLEFTRENIGPAIQEYSCAQEQANWIIRRIGVYLGTRK